MIPARPNSPAGDSSGCDPELEQIAAFVDGSLEGAARDDLVAHLATCSLCTELVAETAALAQDEALVSEIESALERPQQGEVADEPSIQANRRSAASSADAPVDLSASERTPEHLAEIETSGAVHDDLDEARAPDDDEPLQTSQGSTRFLDAARPERRQPTEALRSEAAGAGRWFAVAAGVLALLAAGWWLSTRGANRFDTGKLVADLGTGPALREGLPANWIDGRWDVMRGETTVTSAPAEAAFQLGARSVDLAVALRAADRLTARAVAMRIDSVLNAIGLPPNLAVPNFQLEQALRQPSEDLSDALAAAESFDKALESVEPANAVDAGKWAAAAQVAAMTENAAFFGSTAWLSGLDIIGAESASRSLRGIVERLRVRGSEIAAGGSAGVFPEVEREVRSALRLLGDGDASLDQGRQ